MRPGMRRRDQRAESLGAGGQAPGAPPDAPALWPKRGTTEVRAGEVEGERSTSPRVAHVVAAVQLAGTGRAGAKAADAS